MFKHSTLLAVMLAATLGAPLAGAMPIDFTFATGIFGQTLTSNCSTNPCTVGGVQLWIDVPSGPGSPNYNADQGWGNSNNGGPLAAGETLRFTFSQSIALNTGTFRFLTEGEGFSIMVDGNPATNFYAPAGVVSNNYETLSLGGLAAGTAFTFTGLPYSGPSSSGSTSFRISALNLNVVPEPGALSLLGVGLVGLSMARRRRAVR